MCLLILQLIILIGIFTGDTRYFTNALLTGMYKNDVIYVEAEMIENVRQIILL